MRIRPVSAIAPVMALLWVAIADAQTGAGALPTLPQDYSGPCDTLNEAVLATLKNDARLKISDVDVEIARAELDETKAGGRLNVSAYSRGGSGRGGFLADNQTDNQYGLRVDQLLYNFGRQRLAQDQATALLQAERAKLTGSRRSVIQQAGALYLEALRTQALLRVARDKEAYFERLSSTVDMRLEKNVLTLTDAADIRANDALAKAETVQLETRMRAVLEILEELTGRPTACQAENLDNLEMVPLGLTLEDVKSIILDQSPELRQAFYENSAARKRARIEARARLPQINLSGFASQQYNDLTDSWEGRDRIGFSVTANLYAGGALSARKRKAELQIDRTKARQEAIEQEIKRNISELWTNYMHRQPMIEILSEASIQLGKQLSHVEREYELGARLIDDTIAVANRYFSSRSQLANNRFSAVSDALELCLQAGCADVNSSLNIFAPAGNDGADAEPENRLQMTGEISEY